MATDRNLEFGLLALNSNLIDSVQLAEACAEWGGRAELSLADVLVQRGWLKSDDKRRLQEQLNSELTRRDNNSLTKHSRRQAARDEDATHDERDVAEGIDLPPPKIAVASTDALEQTIDQPSSASANIEEQTQFEQTIDYASSQDGPGDDASHIEQTVDLPPQAEKHVHLETIDWKPESRSRYTLTRVHGKGGLGQVWLAVDCNLNREVALKEVLAERKEDEEKLSRLVKEAQITGQLEHPSIIPVYELGTNPDDGKPFYTMRFLRGQTLAERIREYHDRRRKGKSDALELPRLLQAFVSICNAMAYADSRRVVHRDLKPSNIMMGSFGEVIVLDWGLAKITGQPEPDIDRRAVAVADAGMDASKTIDGQVVGSPAFMSPEQAEGRLDLIDGRTDVYGLGAILFTILTGQSPHGSSTTGDTIKDTMELLQRISTGKPPEPRSIESSIPKSLNAICIKAIARDRADRYQTATDLADDVQRWLADEPVSVYREEWLERVARWTRKHRTWTQSIAAALIIVVVVSVIALVLVNSARHREAAARAETEQALEAEQEALDAEKEARQEALRRFRDARDAVDRALTGTSEVLMNYPGFLAVRTQLLEEAAKDYEQFAGEKSNDPELQAEFGRALVRLGDVRHMLNRHEAALGAYQSAETKFRQLANDKSLKKESLTNESRRELAISLNKQGIIYGELGDQTKAEKAFDEAGTIFKQLCDESDDPTHRDAFARSLVTRARSFNQNGQLAQAKTLLESAIEQFQQLADQFDKPEYREATATAQKDLGIVLWKSGDDETAIDILTQAIGEFDHLIRQDPRHDHPEYFETRAACKVELANALRSLGRDAERVDVFQSAVKDFEDLLADRPGVPHYRENLAVARANLAHALHKLGRNEEARVLAYHALEVFVDLRAMYPFFPRYQVEEAAGGNIFGQILSALGEDEDARSWLHNAVIGFDGLTRSDPEQPLYRRRLAISERVYGRMLHRLQLHDEAKTEFVRAIDDFTQANVVDTDDPDSQNEWALCYTQLADLLHDLGMADSAKSFYAKSIEIREPLQTRPEFLHEFALLLATCRDVELHDPPRAIELAKQAVDLAPRNARYQHTLGVAYYAAEDWAKCIEAVNKAAIYRQLENSFDLLRLAMAYHQQGETERAKAAYEQALRSDFMRQNKGDFELLRLRDEAADLLGVAMSEPSGEVNEQSATSPSD